MLQLYWQLFVMILLLSLLLYEKHTRCFHLSVTRSAWVNCLPMLIWLSLEMAIKRCVQVCTCMYLCLQLLLNGFIWTYVAWWFGRCTCNWRLCDSSQLLSLCDLGTLFVHICFCYQKTEIWYRHMLGCKQACNLTLAPNPCSCSLSWYLAEGEKNWISTRLWPFSWGRTSSFILFCITNAVNMKMKWINYVFLSFCCRLAVTFMHSLNLHSTVMHRWLWWQWIRG